MGREEQIKQKAYEISQRYFPDSQNIWARQNIEAQFVQSACYEIVKWADKTMIDKAREWVKNAFVGTFGEGLANSIADEFVKAMDE